MTEALLKKFKAKAVQAGAEIESCDGAAEALEFVLRFLTDHRLTRIAAAPDALALVPGSGDLELFQPSSPQGWDAAEAGLVLADRGVAATGTLVHWDNGDEDRLAWTLPAVCLCLLQEKDVVAEMDDLAGAMVEHLCPRQTPAFAQVSLVTGPSRTADIEGELCLGVHGPGRLIILLLKS